MATTVTYKGQTLTTVENAMKTLQTAGTWVEDDFTLTDVTQGGGGGALTRLDEITLTENVRSVTINIEAWRNYDMLIIYATGELTASDWIYWNIDATTFDSGKYSNQRQIIDDPYILMVAPASPTKRASLVWQSTIPSIITHNMAIDMSTVGFFWLSGYSKDIKAGTKIRVYGANYADL